MAKQDPQIDIAVLKEQIIQFGKDQVEIKVDIAVIKDKLDDTFVRKADFEPFTKANQDTHVDIDKRLTALENWRWYIAGGLALFGFLALLLVTIYK